MSIIQAFALPHPPLAIPEVGRGEERNIQKTLAAFDEVANEIAALEPETIIFITPHNVLYSDYFHISPGRSAKGDMSRFNASDIQFEVNYDTELATKISQLAEQAGLRAGMLGEKDARLDHGVTVPMWFIDRRYKDYQTVRISQSGMEPAEHYRLGQIIAQAAKETRRKTVLIASGDLSHKLSPSGPYGFAKEGADFDKIITEIFLSANFLSLFHISEEMRESAAECGYHSFLVLAGCLDRVEVEAKLLSYEGPFGVGYAVASFVPKEAAVNRNFLDQYTKMNLERVRQQQQSEDAYQSLARQSLEAMINNGRLLELPTDLPDEMIKRKAGVFVSLYKNDRLRGCVGTITPTMDCVALEIIQNAVSAGLHDHRFEPVTPSELPFLTYKVDILSETELIAGPEELDVKRYGVIVSSGQNRGLLLPNLEGIDTVEEQIAIAKRKAGIAEKAPVKLERFEVIRHE